MAEIKKHLLKLEETLEFEFWIEIKIQVYRADFKLKQQSDQISSIYKPEGVMRCRNLLTAEGAAQMWVKLFGEKVEESS